MLLLFILKLIDNALSTFKTIYLIQGRYILSAILNALAQFVYFVLVVKLVQNNDILSIFVVSIAVFLGSLIPQFIMQKDKIWIFEITPEESSLAKELADKLREINLPVMTFNSYLVRGQKTLSVRVYSQSKAESRMIAELIGDCKFVCHEVKNMGGNY